MAPRLTKFNDTWLKTYPWISKADEHRAYCKYCKTSFKISNTGEISIKDHANSKGHKSAAKGVLAFFRKYLFI